MIDGSDPSSKLGEGDLGYVTIAVADTDRAAAFFGGLFGWRVERPRRVEGQVYRHVSSTSLPLGLTSATEEPSPRLYFRVTSVHAAVARVCELGGTVEQVVEAESGAHAHCRDDQGTPFSLWQPAGEP